VSPGIAAAILGDWRVSGFMTIMSGLPFGATNTPQFSFTSNRGTANGTKLASSSFGDVTSVTGGRALQLGLKFNF